jgi:GAF domain-containing protein
VPTADNWDTLFAMLRDGSAAGQPDELLDLALSVGHNVAAGMAGCSLTELDGVSFHTPAASTALAMELDQAQYAAAEGPCVAAARDRRAHRIDALATEARFSAFVSAALQHGVRSSLSVPIAGRHSPTALNLYSTVESAFTSQRTLAIADLLARLIGSASNQHVVPSTDPDQELTRARQRGDGVNTAVEQVMRQTGQDRAAAFASLTARSRTEQASMHTVAEEVLGDGRDLP